MIPPIIPLMTGIGLLSFTAILSKLIVWPVVVTVFSRALLAALFLWVWHAFQRPPAIQPHDRYRIMISGIFLAIHWWTYFKAVELAGVAIGLAALFTFPMITALVEPWALGSKWSWKMVASALIGGIGVAILVWGNATQPSIIQGVAIGICSAIAYTCRNLIAKPIMHRCSGTQVMQVQSGVAALIYLPIILLMPNLTTNLQLSIDQWIYMFALGTVFTGIAHALFVQGLAHFSASFISILGCIQPLLGTLMGILILNEQPNISTWIGGGIILIAVIMATVATPVAENSDH